MARRKNRPKQVPIYSSHSQKIIFFSGTTLKEIAKLQRSTKLLIPKLCFSKLVREILQRTSDQVDRFKSDALLALQEATEMYLTQYFEDANMCAHHANRITLQPKDMQLVKRLRPVTDPGHQY